MTHNSSHNKTQRQGERNKKREVIEEKPAVWNIWKEGQKVMKIMLSSDVICLLSGLLSRQSENERCPHSQIHFPSFCTAITNVPTCPIWWSMKREDKEKEVVWIYKENP